MNRRTEISKKPLDEFSRTCQYRMNATNRMIFQRNWSNHKISENCEKLDAVENMTDEGSCIRLRSLICALKGAQRDDIEQMKEVITGIIPQVSLYFVQAYELWLAAESRNEVTLDLEPNDDLSLGSFSFLPIDAPHDQINEEIYR